MPVRIVTDSAADLPPDLATDLGITVVPLYVHLGNDAYRDGIDISHEDLYGRLVAGRFPPATSQPRPSDFADVYRTLSRHADAIVSIHVASKLSGTFDAAVSGKKLAGGGCPIEVVDSRSVSMGLGMVVIAAARRAAAAGSLESVMAELGNAIPKVRILGMVNNLKYLAVGGRIGKASALLGSALRVTPLITLRDGEIFPAGQTRTRARGVERLFDFVRGAVNAEEIAIVHSTTPEEARTLGSRLAALVDSSRIHLSRLGPALGVHSGPGTLVIVLREATRTSSVLVPALGHSDSAPVVSRP